MSVLECACMWLYVVVIALAIKTAAPFEPARNSINCNNEDDKQQLTSEYKI